MSNQEQLGEKSRLSVPNAVLSRRVADETVLLNLDNEQYYGLEGVGTRFWELIEGGTTFGDAVDTLRVEYRVDHEVLLTDLQAIVVDLRSHGLLLVDAA
jgi:coenzyme PQQ synthesis protein D (PqqD)